MRTAIRRRNMTWARIVAAALALGQALALGSGAAQARTPYFGISYRTIPRGSEMNPDELPFWASHYDILINPHTPYLGQLESLNPTQVKVVYVNYYCLYVGDGMYRALQNYCTREGISFEGMFIHYAEPTTARFGTETYTLPAGSRVPTYGWYGSSGDLTRDGARVVLFPGNPDFRAFLAEYVAALVTRSYEGVSYDGVFVDNTVPGIPALPTVTSGGALAEYPGDGAARAAAYNSDIAACFAAVKAALDSLGKVQTANVANYHRPDIYPYLWAVLHESALHPRRSTSDIEIQGNYYRAAREAGAINLAHANTMTTDADRVASLAQYYIVFYEPGNTYFIQTQTYGGVLATDQWFPALEFDPGAPLGPYYVFARGVDPTSPVRDSGTCEQVQAGPLFKFRDSTKAWTANALAGKKFADANGNTFTIHSNTADTIAIWWDRDGGPVAGPYEVGTYLYRVLAREYERALMLWKGFPTGSSDRSVATATTHPLPVTEGAPDGVYHALAVNGQLGPPQNTVTLRNTEGVFLVKSAFARAPIITMQLSVLPVAPRPGDIVTYTVTYANVGPEPCSALVVRSPIPEATDYVEGSASAAGVLDGSAVVWQVAGLGPGEGGSVSYQVRVR